MFSNYRNIERRLDSISSIVLFDEETLRVLTDTVQKMTEMHLTFLNELSTIFLLSIFFLSS